MKAHMKEFGTKTRTEQKTILIRCFRNLGKTYTGAAYAKDVMMDYPAIFSELMTEINAEWSAAKQF